MGGDGEFILNIQWDTGCFKNYYDENFSIKNIYDFLRVSTE